LSTLPPASAPALCRILSLDGGGAKGFYTLGVLNEIEAMLGRPLYEHFDLIFGTSTGAIIAALLALGFKVDDVHEIYKKHVPTVTRCRTPHSRSKELANLADTVFGKSTFRQVKTRIGIVATRWQLEKPMIFKGGAAQAHGRHATFVPGFGCTIADAVRASCSAYPYFEKCTLTTSTGNIVELIDGGYCANNPTLYAIADAVRALGISPSQLRVVSVGVGIYPEPEHWVTPKHMVSWMAKLFVGFTGIQLLQKTLNVNTESMEQLRLILFGDIQAVRINDKFEQPEMATDLMESDLKKLNLLYQQGGESFAKREIEIRKLLDIPAHGGDHA
jgi:predicted acylesterase/phospholipase RssA